MVKYCSNCNSELKEDTNVCLKCGKFSENQNKFEIINYISCGFSILLFIFTIYLVYTRYIHKDDPECLICGFSLLCNYLISPAFTIILILSIIYFGIKKNKPSLLSLILIIISFIIYQFVYSSLYNLFQ